MAALSCGRGPANPAHQRWAILRFENVGPDPSTDWMGRAFSEVIGAELAEAPGIYILSTQRLHGFDRTMGARPVSAPGISAERSQALAAGADRIGYGDFAVTGGRLRVHLTVMDPRTEKATQSLDATAAPGAVLDAAGALARQISNRIVSYPTVNPEALRNYAVALEAPDPAAMEAAASLAIGADPNFTRAYRTLAEAQAAQGNREAALATLNQASAHADGAPPAERARIQVDQATLESDAAARYRALAALAKASPGDPAAWRVYGQTAFVRHDYRPAVEAFQKALALEPGDTDSLNQMAYAEAYLGNLASAVTALRRYQALRPTDPNPLDSLGDVHLIAGRLREAESFYLEAARKNRDFLSGGEYFKAAMARLMSGDVAGADALARQFTDYRVAAKDPDVDLLRGQWNWLSGRRQQAARDLETFATAAASGPQRDLVSRAWSQLAVWRLVSGDRAAAAGLAAKAVSPATPASAATALLVRFLAEPSATAAEWTARADKLLPRPEQRTLHDYALGNALLLAGEFDGASVVLRRLYDNGEAPLEEGLTVMLAWAYLGSGRVNDAAPLLAWNPLPPPGGPGLFAPVYFPRLFALQAEVAEKAGRREEAEKYRRLFQQLSK